jgi:hypothetical protein
MKTSLSVTLVLLLLFYNVASAHYRERGHDSYCHDLQQCDTPIKSPLDSSHVIDPDMIKKLCERMDLNAYEIIAFIYKKNIQSAIADQAIDKDQRLKKTFEYELQDYRANKPSFFSSKWLSLSMVTGLCVFTAYLTYRNLKRLSAITTTAQALLRMPNDAMMRALAPYFH